MASTTANEAATPQTGPRGPLNNRDFRLFWLGTCVSFIGNWVQIIAMGLFVYRLTGSKQWLGLIGLAGGLPTTALMLFGGVLADRANKRALLVSTQLLFALSAFTLAALTWTGMVHIWHIIALSFVNGLVFAADGPARQAMVQDLVGREDLAAGVALQSASFNIARVIGPAIGSLLYAGTGPAACFFINGVSFAAPLLAVLLIRTDISRRAEAAGSVWYGLMEGLHYLRTNAMMRGVVGLTAVTSVFAFSAYSTLMPALARDMLGIGEGDPRYGWLFSAIGIGSLVGAFLVGRFATANRRGLLMVIGANVFACALIALARTTHVWLALAVFVVIGMAAIAQLATANTLTQSLAPEGLRGRAVSAHMFAMGGLQPFGAFLAGTIAQRLGVPAALILGAVVFWVYTVGLLALRPTIAKLE